MNQQEQERAQAWEELNFWRDFARWWQKKHGTASEPRIVEAVILAERRYARALALLSGEELLPAETRN